MVNRHRGEIEATLDGKSYRLCLTLGSLAELEHAFGEDDMLAVAERFEAGRIAARDAIRMIGAGLGAPATTSATRRSLRCAPKGAPPASSTSWRGCSPPPSPPRGLRRGATLSAKGRRQAERNPQ